MSDFIEPLARLSLEAQGLTDFAALWLEAPAGGELSQLLFGEGSTYYLLRRSGPQPRRLWPLRGAALLGRERRQTQRALARQVPVLPVLLHAERQVGSVRCAVLLLQVPEGLRPLSDWLAEWASLEPRRQHALLRACGEALRSLHAARLRHAALSPATLLLRAEGARFEAFLCHLQHSRALWRGRRDRLRDLQALQQHSAPCWGAREWQHLLGCYLDEFERLDRWLQALGWTLADTGARG